MNTLLICEKDNAARRIAAILSNGKQKTSKMSRIPVYDFEKNGESYTIMGLKGHVVNPDYPQEFNNWNKVKPRDLIRVKPIKKITQKSIVDVLSKLGREADRVIIATDYDREGELIGVEALEIIKKKNSDFEIKRSRFSSLTPAEISKAFDNLVEVDYNLSAAAESRQLIDLSWGAVLTRFISTASRQMGRDFLSVGRVQSPTLTLIVDREKERKAFVPQPYWEILTNCRKDDMGFAAKHRKDRFWKKEEAQAVWEKVKDATQGKVTGLNLENRKELPPPPFNTTAIQREATKIGLSPSQTMNIAENLYNNGYISYPRTDNTVYPPTLNLQELVHKFSASKEFGSLARKLEERGVYKPTRGKKQTTDHPPIHPVQYIPKEKLSSQEWKLYNMIVRRFFATLGTAAKIEKLTVEIDIETEPFITRGQRYLEMGWREFYPFGIKKDSILPGFVAPGEARDHELLVDVDKLDFLDKETQPPTRYSLAKLIQLMEDRELGTKSTRHTILTKLYDRGYIDGTPPVPTEIGYSVIDALQRHAEHITKSQMTSTLEEDMDLIAEGKKELDEVVDESQDYLEKIVDLLEEHRAEIGKEIRVAIEKKNEVGNCPKCDSILSVKRSRYGKRFVGCTGFPNCRQTYPLPPYGKVVATGEYCERCKAPFVLVYNKKRGQKPWRICINLQCSKKQQEEKRAEANKGNEEKGDEEKKENEETKL